MILTTLRHARVRRAFFAINFQLQKNKMKLQLLKTKVHDHQRKKINPFHSPLLSASASQSESQTRYAIGSQSFTICEG